MKSARVKWVLAVAVVLAACGIVWAQAWYRTSQRNLQCVRNLEQIGAALRLYTNDSKGEYFPPLSQMPGRLMFERDAVYPKYLTDAQLLVSPFHPEYVRLQVQDSDPASLIDDNSYWYLGYLFANERSALAWIDEYKTTIPMGGLPQDVNEIWPEYVADLEARDKEIHVRYEEALAGYQQGLQPDPRSLRMMSRAYPRLHEIHFIHTLRSGAERFLITDVGNPAAPAKLQSEIPVMVERPELHGNGGHVLYMDGHVEFVPYPGPFPMTEPFIEGLRSLDRMVLD